MELDQDATAPSRAWAALAIVGVLSRASILTFVVVAQLIAACTAPDWEARGKAGDKVGVLITIGVGGGAVVSLLAACCAALAFLVWLRIAIRRAHAYGLPHPNATPGGAIVCWFIPFINLIRPYTVIQSLHRASRAHAPDLRGDLVSRWPRLLPLWWGAWLVGTVLTNAYFRLWSGLHASAQVSWLGVVAAFALLIAASCAAVIIWSVQLIQEAVVATSLEDAAPDLGGFRPPESVTESLE